MKKVAIVTGATRGLGWGTALALAKKNFHVVLVGRNRAKLEERKRSLEAEGAEASMVEMDLADTNSVENGISEIQRSFHDGIDLLVNNAGIFPERETGFDIEKVRAAFETNTLAPLQIAMGLGELLKKRKGTVVNVSSGMGGLTEMNAGYPGYRISKTALNAVTRYLSEEWKSAGVKVNSVCPGWVRTDMGGAEAERPIEQGVASILWAALLPADGPSGGFYRDGKPLEW